MADEEGEGEKFEPKSLLIKIAVFICVLFIGAIIFVAIETTEAGKNSAIHILPNVVEIKNLTSKYNISRKDFERLKTLITKNNFQQDEVKWTFSRAVFLTFTIMTTIGKVLKI